ncbi:MAG: DUF1015 domain-containing protein [Actinomycetota bacterium]|nr:DUF1015 domain-containing protein [Actinomycetota bacterium]
MPVPTGLELTAFRALRYDPDVVGDLSGVTSPPYDVIDADGVAALEASSDFNVVRLILPREEPGHTGDRYRRAADTLGDWRARGALVPDPEPALYVYEQRTPHGHVQRGLLGALALSPPEDGIVLPHENTMAGPVSDRLALYTAVGADLEPIFLVYGGGGAASAAVTSAPGRTPALIDVDLPDGFRHRLWALTDPTELTAISHDLSGRHAVIADGHHRYATYLQRQADRHASGAGPGPWDFGLTFLVDDAAFGPEVHAIHRVVPGHRSAELARAAAQGATVREVGGLTDGLAALAEAGLRGPAFLLADGSQHTTWLVTDPDPIRMAAAMPAERSGVWRRLDVSVLHAYVVQELWQLADREDTVGYEHDVPAALAAAERGAGTAVLLNPTPVSAVTRVAAGGERMPRKSTLFTPKPRTGLVIRDHRDA